MKATLKVDLINKYREPRKTDVPMTATERKEYRRSHPNAKEEDLVTVKLEPHYYGKTGDTITIISENPGAWQIVVTAENKIGERFCVRWDELNTHTNEGATSK